MRIFKTSGVIFNKAEVRDYYFRRVFQAKNTVILIASMKKITMGLIIFAALCHTVFAGDFFLQAGAGVGKSFKESEIGIRYQHDTSRLFGLPSYYEVAYLYWNNDSRAHGLGVARSLVWSNSGSRSFDASLGLMGINRTTDHLGTKVQLYFRFSYAFTVDDRNLSIDLIHLSNGKILFGWDGPNSGENFIAASIGLF